MCDHAETARKIFARVRNANSMDSGKFQSDPDRLFSATCRRNILSDAEEYAHQ